MILAPGSYARSIPGLDPDGERIITSDDALRSDAFPKRIAVIGASGFTFWLLFIGGLGSTLAPR